jgi:hypothetical protein
MELTATSRSAAAELHEEHGALAQHPVGAWKFLPLLGCCGK